MTNFYHLQAVCLENGISSGFLQMICQYGVTFTFTTEWLGDILDFTLSSTAVQLVIQFITDVKMTGIG